jgi:hypothetical protein
MVADNSSSDASSEASPIDTTTPGASGSPMAPSSPNGTAIPTSGALSAGEGSFSTGGITGSTGGESAAPITGPGATSGGGATSAATTGGGGRIPFHVTVGIGESYDDNIFIQPHKTSDYITTLNAKFELRLGDGSAVDSNLFSLYYQPTGLLYARHSKEDSLNHNVDVLFQHRFTRLVLSLEQSYARAQSTNAAFGNLVTSEVYNTIATADYSYSDKFDIRGTFTQNFTDFQNPGYTSSREWDGDLYFLYHYDPRFSFGLGPRFGFLDIQQAPNQTFQELLARANYAYSGKLNFSADAGGELREYQGGTPGDTATPVLDISANYTPTNTTLVSLVASRHYSPSYNFIGQDFISSAVDLSFSQQFLEKFNLRLTLGYENDDYGYAAPNLTGGTREDNYFFANPGVDWRPNGWLVVSAYYRYQRDDSNFDAYTFNDNQAGLSLSATY